MLFEIGIPSKNSSSRFSLIRALDGSPQDLQTSDLNYTVSVTWMGYFVDDAKSQAARKATHKFIDLGIDSLACLPTNVFTTPIKRLNP